MLSPPMLETLTIVGYRQPITRADIEAIRGVQSAEMLRQLMERGLVKIGGEDDSLGRPYLYITTRRFLELFGIHSLRDLPMADRLRRLNSDPGETSHSQDEAFDNEPEILTESVDGGPDRAIQIDQRGGEDFKAEDDSETGESGYESAA